MTIDRSEFAVLVGPLVPDTDTMFLEVLDVGVALEEPEQFVDDGLQMKFLCGEQGETVVEVVARLGAEDADGTCTGTVTFFGAFGEDAVEDVEILFHMFYFFVYSLQFTVYR